MVVEILRRIAGLRSDASVRPGLDASLPGDVDFDEVITRLQQAKLDVDALKTRLVNEINDFHDKMVEAARNKDNEALEMMAAEMVIKRRVLQAILAYGKLLNVAIQRINDARNMETLIRVVAPLEYLMKAMDEYFASVSPEMVTRLSSVIEATERVIRGAQITAEQLPLARSITEIDPEVRAEIAKVVAEAKMESEKIAPATISPKEVIVEEAPRKARRREASLEEKLLDYIKMSGGSISVPRVASVLGVTEEQVKEALRKLESRGVIRVKRARKYRASYA